VLGVAQGHLCFLDVAQHFAAQVFIQGKVGQLASLKSTTGWPPLTAKFVAMQMSGPTSSEAESFLLSYNFTKVVFATEPEFQFSCS
jgi:hypothetical protein